MNNNVYDMYCIEGFPCHFYTKKAVEKYNKKIMKWCKHLKISRTDLKKTQRIKRFLYIRFLEVADAYYAKEKETKSR